jgi:hypothetical protein
MDTLPMDSTSGRFDFTPDRALMPAFELGHPKVLEDSEIAAQWSSLTVALYRTVITLIDFVSLAHPGSLVRADAGISHDTADLKTATIHLSTPCVLVHADFSPGPFSFLTANGSQDLFKAEPGTTEQLAVPQTRNASNNSLATSPETRVTPWTSYAGLDLIFFFSTVCSLSTGCRDYQRSLLCTDQFWFVNPPPLMTAVERQN